MNKSLQEQLANLASSLGFDVKKERQEVTKPHATQRKITSTGYTIPVDMKLQNIIQLASVGRNGAQLRIKNSIDISAFLKFILDCKQKGKISETDAYFCLCAVANIEEFSTSGIDEFQKTFRNIETRMLELINFKKVDRQDLDGFRRQLEISKIRDEKIRKQKEIESHVFL